MTRVWGWCWFRNLYRPTGPLWSKGTPVRGSGSAAELPAGGVDVDAAGSSDGGADPAGLEPPGEVSEASGGGGSPREAAGWVQGDQVHVGSAHAGPRAEEPTQGFS